MIIKRLTVKKMQPIEEIIREIKFNEKGLNLIVDNTYGNVTESGNNVGKTTAIKIIDLCLGAKSVSTLYYDPDTRSENIVVKNFLIENKVQAELIVSDKAKEYSIKRDLFPRGKRYISDREYTREEFWEALKKIFFDLDEPNPTFRQLIPKFIRLQNYSEDSMIKYLPHMTPNITYDTIYCILFRIHNQTLVNKKTQLIFEINECQRAIAALEKSKSISSLSALCQSKEIINTEYEQLLKKRQELSYMDMYRDELEKKRCLTSRISDLQEKMQLLEYEIEMINTSISSLSKEKEEIDFDILHSIYSEANSYIPDLHKSFEDVVAFHNKMIQDRIEFIQGQLGTKKELLRKYSLQLEKVLSEKEAITIEVLDEGLLDELNLLNTKIEELSYKRGEIEQSITLLEEQEREIERLSSELHKIEEQMSRDNTKDSLTQFNQIFTDYCFKLYGEKYFLNYNPNWEGERKFPVTIDSLRGALGTGKKKGVIVAFDLAYMQYSIQSGIAAPHFVIHDKMENTHINQLSTIFEMCKDIDGQYIIPILRERIDKVDQKFVDKARILELSSDDKFFRI